MHNSVDTGNKTEDIAVDFLQNAGLQILHRNFRTKYGEIDLIAHDKQSLIFIEVRYRKNDIFGSAAETVTTVKQQRIIHAAEFYLQTRPWAQKLACRFDVVSMTQSMQGLQIEWIKDAFHA